MDKSFEKMVLPTTALSEAEGIPGWEDLFDPILPSETPPDLTHIVLPRARERLCGLTKWAYVAEQTRPNSTPPGLRRQVRQRVIGCYFGRLRSDGSGRGVIAPQLDRLSAVLEATRAISYPIRESQESALRHLHSHSRVESLVSGNRLAYPSQSAHQ